MVAAKVREATMNGDNRPSADRRFRVLLPTITVEAPEARLTGSQHK